MQHVGHLIETNRNLSLFKQKKNRRRVLCSSKILEKYAESILETEYHKKEVMEPESQPDQAAQLGW